MADKLKIATTSLAGCFGCHMSLLDIDERMIELAQHVEFDRSPITDIEHCSPCDIGLIEGGVCNSENVHTLREFRKNCKVLVAVGACAINGGLPAMRNHFKVEDCLNESYIDGLGVENAQIPSDPELPLLLDKVHPIHEIVKVDYYMPGCPPSGDVFWKFLSDIIAGQEPSLPYDLRGVAIFAKACFGHPSPSKRQKLNATAMPSAPRFVLVTTSRPNRGSEHWLQMT